jgi:formylmethanofuran dehydrogenase subunit C
VNDWVILTARSIDASITAPGLDPSRFAELSERDIASLPASRGRERATVGDFFSVRGERSTRVRIEGSTRQVDGLGAGMTGGELDITGDAGALVGAGMTGGTLRVHGSAGHAAGQAMSGGTLRIDGNAGDRVGGNAAGAAKGMTGGEIVVGGSVGAEAGARMRRGLIVVCGDVARDAGRAMIAGSLFVLGSCGDGLGRGSKRGSIVACGSVPIPPTYRYACTYRPTHVRLTLIYLSRRYGLIIDPSLMESAFRRFCGDAGEPGKGEILERVRAHDT